MALHLILSRNYDVPGSVPAIYNISRIPSSSSSDEWSTINLSPQFPKNIASMINHVNCSGNGLLCFCYGVDCEDDEYVIWNPSTDKWQLIPPTDSRYLPCLCSTSFPVRDRDQCERRVRDSGRGLGFVAESHDFKFVRFMINFDYEVEDDGEHDRLYHVADYSSKNNSWNEVPFPFGSDFYPKGDYGHGFCVNGFCYWTTAHVDVILSLDLSTENFSTLPYPPDVVDAHFEPAYNVFFLELDGSLCLVIKFESLFNFWVYEGQGSSSPTPWTRKINLDVRLQITKPLWLGKKNNRLVVLLQGFDGALLEYDYTNSARELKKIDQIHDDYHSIMMICCYVETDDQTKNILMDVDGVDRISRLPDDIILIILSLLPLKEAASTTVLSTRWSDLWRHTPNLNFNFNFNHAHDYVDSFINSHLKRYIKLVNSVVESHKSTSLKEFNISFPLKGLNKPARRTLAKWLPFAFSRRTLIKWLRFAFSRRVRVLELSLFRTKLVFLENFLQERSILKSANLTSLCLKCLVVSGEAIGLFLRNCPLLERLIIKYACVTSDIEVCGGVLKHLDIQYCRGDGGSRMNLIKGYAPILTYLRIDSGQHWCSPILVWDYTQQPAHDPPLICFISSQLTTLEFTLHPKDILEKGFPQIPTLKHLIVACERGHGISPITSLICAFPYLEEFEIKLYRLSRIEHIGMEVMKNNVESFRHHHLRVFKFTWFDVDDGDHMELMSYILDSCFALQKIFLHKYVANSPSYAAAWEYVKQLRSELPTHIQLIDS